MYRRAISTNSPSSSPTSQAHKTDQANNSTTNAGNSSSSLTTRSLATYSDLKMTVNASRDRTSEFHSAVRSFQSRMTVNPVAKNAGNGTISNKEAIERRNVFMRSAKQIGKELTTTCIKLEKLTDLVKKKSLFDDKPRDIEELTYLIKQDLLNLQNKIADLQRINKASQTQDGKNMQKHAFNVVYTLQSKLANVSNEFRSALETRNENFKHQTERGEQYFSKNTLSPTSQASIFSPPNMPGSNMGRSVLLYQSPSTSSSGLGQTHHNDSSSHGSIGNGGSDTVLNMDLMQKQQLQKRLIVNEEEMFLRERANAMQTVEQTIVELGSMFQQLAGMIKEQDEAIQRIDSNIDDVDLNVSQAHGELLKYFQSVTSNRWLMIKIFAILIIFFVSFVVLMT